MMTVRLNGVDFDAWTSVSVNGSMKDSTRSFSAEVAEADAGPLGLSAYWAPPGTEVQIFADDGSMLLDGYVNEYTPSFSATSHSVKIAGRSKSQDAADSSVDHPTGNFKNKSALEIANEIGGPVGTTYSSDDTLPPLAYFQINQGERVHQVVRRLANTYGYALMSTGGAEVKFCKAGDTIIGEIGEGVYPLLEASATMKDTDKHSSYKSKSQLSSQQEKYSVEAAHPVAEVKDESVKRNRPKIHVVDKSADMETAQKKAEWNAKQASADSLTVSATIYGHTLNGALVEPNVRILVQSTFLKVFRTMLVESVDWECSVSGGTTCKIDLVLPSAYDGEDGASQSSTDAKQDAAYDTPKVTPVQNTPTQVLEDRSTRVRVGDLST